MPIINTTSSRQSTSPIINVKGDKIEIYGLPIIANSASFTLGLGTQMVKSETVGAGNVRVYFCDDDSEKVGDIKLSMKNNPFTKKFVMDCKEQAQLSANGLEVQFIINEPPNIDEVIFTQARLINEPTFGFSTDGEIELEFKSNPALTG